MRHGVKKASALAHSMSFANKARLAAALAILISLTLPVKALAWQWSGNVISSAGGRRKAVALTFDDGPHPVKTPEILELLSNYGIHATFFVTGDNASLYPEIIQQEIDGGHEIGNHTYSHVFLKKVPFETAKNEICALDDLMLENFEYKPKLLRPPGGLYNDKICRFANDLGYEVVLWSIDTRDWAHTPAREIADCIINNVKNGDIILCHDFVGGTSYTARALRTVIPKLLEMGYEFVTVSELLGTE